MIEPIDFHAIEPNPYSMLEFAKLKEGYDKVKLKNQYLIIALFVITVVCIITYHAKEKQKKTREL